MFLLFLNIIVIYREMKTLREIWNLFFFPVRNSEIYSTFFLKYLQGEFLNNYTKFVGLW